MYILMVSSEVAYVKWHLPTTVRFLSRYVVAHRSASCWYNQLYSDTPFLLLNTETGF